MVGVSVVVCRVVDMILRIVVLFGVWEWYVMFGVWVC